MATTLRREKKLKGKFLGLIDYDIVTYSAGHASDTKYYVAPDGLDFKYKKDVVAHCIEMDYDQAEIQMVLEPAPIEHCLFTVKQMVHNIALAADCNNFKGYLTGKGNFREAIDSIQPYKGTRHSTSKPHWYDEIREYLVKHQKGVVVDGIEADDAMSIAQCTSKEDTTIICTKDKDLWMVPGWKYDWGSATKEPRMFKVSEEDGMRWFYRQLLMGDSVDNIMGCGHKVRMTYQSGAKIGQEYDKRKGIGKEGSKIILMTCHTEQEMYEEVLACYLDHDLTEYDLLENANLLWMMRKEGEHWMPPK
jgi:hypothetical protein